MLYLFNSQQKDKFGREQRGERWSDFTLLQQCCENNNLHFLDLKIFKTENSINICFLQLYEVEADTKRKT